MIYLDTWKSVVSKTQGEWIDRLVHRLQQESKLSDSELIDELDRLTQLVGAASPATLSRLLTARSDQLIDAEGFNLMLGYLAGDLLSAFAEAENLGRLQAVYQQLYEQRIITELRHALGRLEAEALRLGQLGYNHLGFTHSQINNFTVPGHQTPRTHPLAGLLYRDPRLNHRLTVMQDNVIDTKCQALTLPLNTRYLCQVEKVEIVSRRLGYSLGGQELPNCPLSHLIDQSPDTYWIYQETARQPSPEGLEIGLVLDLGGFTTFSAVEIQPVADFPYYLTELRCENSLGQTINLLDYAPASLKKNPVNQPCRLLFPEQQSRRIHISFTQKSFQTFTPETTSGSAPERLQELYRYTLGLDNILIGRERYSPVGVYVSPMMQVERCALVGLEAEVTGDARHTAVEHWLVKRDLDERENILQTSIIPLLPLTQRQVQGETIILDSSHSGHINDTGRTRFCAHLNGQLLDVKVYEENRRLHAMEYKWLDSLKVPQPARLQLLNPGVNMYYSIDYTPAHLRTTEAYYLNSTKTLWLAGSNAVHCALSVNGREIQTSQLFLVIILRNNPRHPDLTPQVRHFQLLAATAGD